MTKIGRRLALKTMGWFSVGSLLPFSGRASTSMKIPGIELSGLTRKEIDADILVIGGGTAGIIAALQAARAGFSTLLIENGSQLGGTMTTAGVSFPGLFHAWGNQIISGIGWELVTETVRLNDGQLPDFSIPTGRNHPRHQVRLNGPLYAMLAGRCVSSDRLANSALRVQASCMAMGQVAGATAALAAKSDISPVDVPITSIKELLAQHDAIVP